MFQWRTLQRVAVHCNQRLEFSSSPISVAIRRAFWFAMSSLLELKWVLRIASGCTINALWKPTIMRSRMTTSTTGGTRETTLRTFAIMYNDYHACCPYPFSSVRCQNVLEDRFPEYWDSFHVVLCTVLALSGYIKTFIFLSNWCLRNNFCVSIFIWLLYFFGIIFFFWLNWYNYFLYIFRSCFKFILCLF